MSKEQTKWTSKNIYWHRVIWMDEKRIKKNKLISGKYIVGGLYGFHKIEKQWCALNNEKKDITPYIIFKYVGKTLYSENAKERQKSFNKFKKEELTQNIEKENKNG